MAFAITKTWTAEILTAADLNGAFTEIETEFNAFPTDGALAANSVGSSQLSTNAVALANMQDDSVDTDELVDAAVTEAKLGTGAVTNAKLGATSVTAAKVSTLLGTSTLNDSDTNAMVIAETYLSGSDGLLVIIFLSSSGASMTLKSDSNATPTTELVPGTQSGQTVTCPIKKNEYWTITSTANADKFTIRWFPFGSGSQVKQ